MDVGCWMLDVFLFRLNGMEFEKRLAHGLRHKPSHFGFAMKFHLALGGMNVHVHGRGINFHEQTANRVTAFHQRGVVAFEQREVEAAILDRPAIHEDVLVLARGTRRARRADQSPNAEGWGLRVGG